MRVVNFTTIVIRIEILSKVIKIGIIKYKHSGLLFNSEWNLEVPDTTKSNREAIVLRCPRGWSRGRKPPAGSGAAPQRGPRGGAPS